MNIVHKVTLRHLKENKRRSLVTIFGIIISVAMITAVATLGISFLDVMIREHIDNNGEWHVQYKNIDDEQLRVIEQDSDTKNVTLSTNGYAILKDSANSSKPYLFFQNYNDVGMEQFPIELKEGSLPSQPNEIAISEAIQSNAKVNYEIGDEITVDIGERVASDDGHELNQNYSLVRDGDQIQEELQNTESKTLTIVGVIERPTWEPAWSPGYTVIGYVDEQLVSEQRSANAFVVLKDVKTSLYDHAKKLANKHNIEAVSFNSDLLRYYGVTANDQLRRTLFSLAGIVMGIIIIGSVALIYNAFAISVSERARHLGMLSSVGATRKQKRNSVFFEGAIIGAISIPIGIVAGLAGIGLTFLYINTFIQDALNVSQKFELIVTPASIVVACFLSLVTIFISTYIPAQKASKISAMDAIRQTQDIKLSGKSVRTSKLVRKIFGIEAEIGLKNMKRNKKRYLATLLSLIISIILFLTVSFFTDNLKKSLELSQDSFQFDILIQGNEMLNKDELTRFTEVDYVTKSAIVDEIEFDTLVDMDAVAPPLKEDIDQGLLVLENDQYQYYVRVHGLDEDNFRTYAEKIGINTNEFNKQEIPQAILIGTISYEDAISGKLVETQSMEAEVGDQLDLFQAITWNEENQVENTEDIAATIEISAITDEVPMGVQTAWLGGINLIVTSSTMEQITEEAIPSAYLNSSNPLATQEAIEEIADNNIQIFNVFQNRQQEEQVLLLMSVFIYGFITLISLISIANIFNTISTSISLRKREFAMLRSVGMTSKGFNKMIYYESIFYGVKALTYGLPLSFLVMLAIHKSMSYTFVYGFQLPWLSILFVIAVIFIIVGSAMLYSISKIKNENIIETLKQENI